MSKGEETKTAILDHAAKLASQIGLEGLSIGKLAEDMSLSKSGVFAHFQSKETLQIETLQFARGLFVEKVITPAFKQPRGLPRVRALFDAWLEWNAHGFPGGCLMIAASTEFDDRPGPVRDVLAQTQRDLVETLTHAARIAVQEGHLRADVKPEQFAFEEYGIILSFHHHLRLLADPKARARAQAAFAALVERSTQSN